MAEFTDGQIVHMKMNKKIMMCICEKPPNMPDNPPPNFVWCVAMKDNGDVAYHLLPKSALVPASEVN